jgi:hypothetical protein
MINIHSFTDWIVNTIVKKVSKLYTKLIKHIRSFLVANIQHGFLVELFKKNPYLVNLCFLFVLFEFWAWSTKLNPYFSHMLKIHPIWRDWIFQCIWIIEDRWELTKLYKSTFQMTTIPKAWNHTRMSLLTLFIANISWGNKSTN